MVVYQVSFLRGDYILGITNLLIVRPYKVNKMFVFLSITCQEFCWDNNNLSEQ